MIQLINLLIIVIWLRNMRRLIKMLIMHLVLQIINYLNFLLVSLRVPFLLNLKTFQLKTLIRNSIDFPMRTNRFF